MLPAQHRLRQRADFAAVLRGPGGARASSALLVLHANQTDPRSARAPRVGFVVSKAVGNAVVRNRTKRRLRALMAARLSGIPAGVDVVVRANPLAGQSNSVSLGRALDGVLATSLAKVRA